MPRTPKSRPPKSRPPRPTKSRKSSQVEIAQRALKSKRKAQAKAPPIPASTTPGKGMRPLPNAGIAPSGAFEQEGQRPVLERTRKVR